MTIGDSAVPKSVEIQRHLTSIRIDDWLHYDVLTLRWWLLLCIILIVLLVWWVLLDKSRLYEICLYVVLAAILTMGIYEYGEELVLWDYPTRIIPIFPPLTSVNLILVPLIYSLIYQNFKTKKSFLCSAAAVSILLCLILEPVFLYVKLYELIHLKYYYNFIIHFIAAIIIRLITLKVISITEKNK